MDVLTKALIIYAVISTLTSVFVVFCIARRSKPQPRPELSELSFNELIESIKSVNAGENMPT